MSARHRRDPATPPPLGPTPSLELPPVQRFRLENGLDVLVVEQHVLPVVDVQLVVRTGAAADPPELAGRAALAAEMLDEGTTRRGALEFAETLDFLGADLESRVSWDGSSLSLHVLTPRLEPALELLAEAAIHPAFHEEEWRRVQAERIDQLLQQQDEPRVVAGRAFVRELYGDAHPYGAPVPGTRETVQAMDLDTVVAFYREHYRPNNAYLVVVGDVEPGTLLPLLERAFGAWEPASVPEVRLPEPPPNGEARIVLVDRPGAAQSEIRVGHIGPSRDTPDYFPLTLLNAVLGGAFTSRLNLALREERGYTYGAASRFDFRTGPGPFLAASAVFTGVTDDALAVVAHEIRRIHDEPVPGAELERARNYLALSLPQDLETTADIAQNITQIELYGLGDDYLDRYVERISAVTPEQVHAAARTHLRPDELVAVVVGDAAAIESRLRDLGLGPVVRREVR